jgi:glutathione S-transferase
MDWQISVFLPAFNDVFMGLVRTPPDHHNPVAIAGAKSKSINAAQILDGALARNAYLTGKAFSMGETFRWASSLFASAHWCRIAPRYQIWSVGTPPSKHAWLSEST